MLPVLERLLYRPRHIPQVRQCPYGAPRTNVFKTRVLVLLPTRELALQVCTMAQKLAQFTDVTFGLSVGGMSVRAQEQELRKRPDVLIATPGRLVDHIQNTHSFDLQTIEVCPTGNSDIDSSIVGLNPG